MTHTGEHMREDQTCELGLIYVIRSSLQFLSLSLSVRPTSLLV